jgi:hypothetical protein
MLADMSWLTRLGFVADAQGRRADEAALLARVLRGDAQALALLYRRESGPVYRYALALVGDEAAALDAMQEAFTQLLLNPQGFEPGPRHARRLPGRHRPPPAAGALARRQALRGADRRGGRRSGR